MKCWRSPVGSSGTHLRPRGPPLEVGSIGSLQGHTAGTHAPPDEIGVQTPWPSHGLKAGTFRNKNNKLFQRPRFEAVGSRHQITSVSN